MIHNYYMESENVRVADNQQERLDQNWLTGFVDGEGCFHVGINSNNKLKLGFQVLPEFRLTQHKRDRILLEKIRNYFDYGVVRKNSYNILEYRVRSYTDLNKLVLFFTKYPLKTKKKYDLDKFKKILSLLPLKNEEELKLIRNIKDTMNKGSRY
jgi:hypothetical protein